MCVKKLGHKHRVGGHLAFKNSHSGSSVSAHYSSGTFRRTRCHFTVSGNDSALHGEVHRLELPRLRRAAAAQTRPEREHLHTQLQSSEWRGVVVRGAVLHSSGTVNLFHWSAFRADSSPAPPQSARNTRCRGDKGASLIGTESPLSNEGNTESN